MPFTEARFRRLRITCSSAKMFVPLPILISRVRKIIRNEKNSTSPAWQKVSLAGSIKQTEANDLSITGGSIEIAGFKFGFSLKSS